MIFLFLYYSVLVERNPEKISVNEILLYIWFLAFAYDELSEYVDAGSIFYATDVSLNGPFACFRVACLHHVRYGTFLISR